MPQIAKSCCGSFCVVAGSDKCCEHEIRKEYRQRLQELLTYRYGCPCCRIRRRLQYTFCYNVIDRKVYQVANQELFGKPKANKYRAPVLLPAVVKTDCSHYCRNDTNEWVCCQCRRAASSSGQQYVSTKQPSNMCDCCHARSVEQRTPAYEAYRQPTRRRQNRKSRASKLPKINFTTDEEIEEYGTEDPFVDEKASDIACELGESAPSDLSQESRSRPLSQDDWPSLPVVRPVDETEKNSEQQEEAESVVIVDADTVSQSEQWELLSAADSVWTLDSSIQDSGVGSYSNPPPRSFRDVAMASVGAESVRSDPSVIATPKKNRMRKTMSAASCSAVPGTLFDDDGDFLAELRDGYKGNRGGNTKKMYHREKKGREGGFFSWDEEGRFLLRCKERVATKRSCQRLLKTCQRQDSPSSFFTD